MKNLSLIVKTLILFLGAATMASCSHSESAPTAAVQTTAADSTQQKALINIRYIDADSVMSAYVLAQQIAQEGQREMLRYQQQEQAKQRELQNMGNNIQQKQQNNVYLSEASFKADVDAFQKKQQEAESYLAAQQQRIQTALAASQKRLNDSITNFVSDYNKVKGYDAILLREAGVFFNPELDITAEIIDGLNARFEGSQSVKK